MSHFIRLIFLLPIVGTAVQGYQSLSMHSFGEWHIDFQLNSC